MNWKSRIRKLTSWRMKNARGTDEERTRNGWRTVKNNRKSSQNYSRKRLGSVTEAPRLGFSSRKHVSSPKTAKMHSQRGSGVFGTAFISLFIGKGGGGCRPARPSKLGCFHLKQGNAQNPLEGPRFDNSYLHPPHFTKYTPFVFLYRFLSETSRSSLRNPASKMFWKGPDSKIWKLLYAPPSW